MTGAPVSVVVVSQGRPEALAFCLTGLSQLSYPQVEVVVVACRAGLAAVDALGLSDTCKRVPFDAQNISQARNAGIGVAAGEVVAFIDDDAVPEPTWLARLVAPILEGRAQAAGGTVLGRNGISVQRGAALLDRAGRTHPLPIGTEGVVAAPHSQAVKTEGTNMAVRRDVLLRLGAFDPAYAFYLDEGDLNMRLTDAGHATAFAADAVVHHAFAPSDRRRADRAPRDLRQIGRSQMTFLRKHHAETGRQAAWTAFEAERRRWLLRYMQTGHLTPDDVLRLGRDLRAGADEARAASLVAPDPLTSQETAFRPFPTRSEARHRCFGGWAWSRGRLHAKAARAVADGDIATVLRFSPTALFHRHRFTEHGYWVQTGGLFGRSTRTDPLFYRWRFPARVARERARIVPFREQSARNVTDLP